MKREQDLGGSCGAEAQDGRVRRTLRLFFSPRGRIGRRAFALGAAALLLPWFVAFSALLLVSFRAFELGGAEGAEAAQRYLADNQILDSFSQGFVVIWGGIALYALLVSLTIKRLRDMGATAWLALVFAVLVPLWLLIWLMLSVWPGSCRER